MNAQERRQVFQQKPKAKRYYQWTIGALIVELVLILASAVWLIFTADITFNSNASIILVTLLLPGMLLFIVTLTTVYMLSPMGKFWLWLSFGLSAMQTLGAPYLQNLIGVVLIFIAAVLYTNMLSMMSAIKKPSAPATLS